MSTKPRKPTGSFVCDAVGGSAMQTQTQTQTPRVSDMMGYERSPNPMASHSSKTNFIGDSVLPEGPRAVAVSETGEKHSILLDEEVVRNRLNPFASPMSVTPKPTTTTLPPTATASFTKAFNHVPIEKPRLNSAKRTKPARRYINQKPRPVFTPRNRATTPRAASRERPASTAAPSPVTTSVAPAAAPMHINFNAQTQTDVAKPSLQPAATQAPSAAPSTRQSCCTHPQIYHHQQLHHPQYQHQHPLQHQHQHPTATPLPVPLPRRFIRETVGDRLAESPRIQPLRVLAPPSKKLKPKDFSELRSIASALTLITVVSWLFSTFFELEGVLEMLGGLLETLQNWFLRREQPMTKAQLLVEYLRSWWP